MKPPPRRKLVLVEWIDSSSGDVWRSLDEIAAAADEPLYCRSVGWLIVRNRAMTVLAATISGERNGNVRLNGTGDIAIPNRAIEKVTVLRGGK